MLPRKDRPDIENKLFVADAPYHGWRPDAQALRQFRGTLSACNDFHNARLDGLIRQRASAGESNVARDGYGRQTGQLAQTPGQILRVPANPRPLRAGVAFCWPCTPVWRCWES